MTKKYKSDALEALHKTAEGLHRIGLVDQKTMRDFDASCLTTVEKLSACGESATIAKGKPYG